MSEHEPQLQLREAQPYLAIPAHVTTQAEFRRAADPGFPELFGWLAEHGVEPAEEADFTRWETELAYLTTA